jgi:glycosyltransferase involved in cell wall biosynthesis
VVYRASDMLVMPSRSEAMPNALLEAMSLGLPVVATRVGGVPEVADDGEMAWIVEPESAEAIARAVVDCVARPDERARRVDLARARTWERHDPSRRADRYLALYASLGIL